MTHYSRNPSIHIGILNSSSILYRAALGAAMLALTAGNAYALPSDGMVEAGDVNIQQPNADSMVINQSSDKAIINWNSFDILNGQSVRFNQNGSNAVALNRVTGGGGASQILGSLSANGRIVLVNPNGVFFGAGSKVDVAGMIATTADISSGDFMAGNMQFSKAGNPTASIINKGSITAADGGLVALVAPGVRNDGVIQANLGTVTLGGAKTFTVDMYGDNLYSFTLGEKTSAKPLDENGKEMDDAVSNTGTITAQAGHILLTANAARDVVSHAVNNTGVLEASSAYMDGGTVVLAGGEGDVAVSGKIHASAKKSGSKGGSVTVTGKNITVANATIDASGPAAGGTVLIGGDYQGQGSLQRADTANVDADSSINVSATEQGDAGMAVIWSDVATYFAGTITGVGGVLGGNGGVAEVSSKGDLTFYGLVDMHADLGAAGELLLDPLNIYINDLAAAAIEFVLNHNTNVTLSTPNVGPQDGNITVGSTIDWTGSGSLTLNADNNININKDITSTWASGFGNRGAVTLNAGGDIFLNSASIRTASGNVTLNGVNVSLLGGLIGTGSGDIWLNNSGVFFSSLTGSLSNDSAQDGGITLNQNVGGSIQNAVNSVGSTGTAGALLTLGAGTWLENVLITKSNFTLTGQGAGTVVKSGYEPMQASVIFVKGGDNVTISNLKVDADGLIGIHVKNASDVTVKDTRIVRASNAIQLDKTNGVDLESNVISNSGTGILVRNSSDVLAANNMIGSKNNGISVRNSEGVTLRKNGVKAGRNGIQVVDASNMLIDSNIIVNAGRDGIVLNRVNGATINDNIILNAGRDGIRADGLTGGLLMGNLIYGSGRHGIAINNGRLVVLYDNDVLKSGANGIKVINTDWVALLGNHVAGSGKDGMHLSHVNNALVYGNTIKRSGRDGIFAKDLDGAIIAQNTVSDAGRNGISLLLSNAVRISGNDISDVDENGIAVGFSSKVKIAKNNVVNAGLDGIHLEDVNGAVVTGNRVRGSGQDGISATNLSNAELTDNTVKASGRNGVYLVGSSGVTVSDNRIIGSGANGISLSESTDVKLLENTIFRAAVDGIFATKVADLVVDNNNISKVGRDGIYAQGLSGDTSITANTIDGAGRNGINLVASNGTLVALNTVANAKDNGFRISNSDDVTLIGNISTNNGRGYLIRNGSDNALLIGNLAQNNDRQGFLVRDSQSIRMLGNVSRNNGWAGIRLINSDDALLRFNYVAGNARGIRITDSDNAVVRNNWIRHNDEAGIWIERSDNATVRGNRITGNTTGVLVDDSDNTLVVNNTIRRNATGVSINDAANVVVDRNRFRRNDVGLSATDSTDITVSNNRFRGGIIGISFTNVSSSNITGNDLNALMGVGSGGGSKEDDVIAPLETTGIVINGGSAVSVSNNTVSNFTTGLSASAVEGLALSGNSFTNNGVGVVLTGVNGATLSGDIFTGNNLGIDLNGSSNTQLTGLTITTPEGGTGLRIANGSSDTLVSSVSFNGGNIGVLLDGEGSSMQFGDDASSFTGMNFYFVLQNAAMDTEILDASQQTFDGIRASDFTPEQLAAAEAKTLDGEDGPGVGDVFYKSFLDPNGALDEFQRRRAANARRALFSYAGRTVSNNVEEQPTTFQTANINLSLLNSAQPANAAGIANLFANLAPAAGGNNAQALAKLSPSAGGNVTQIAGISNATGGSSLGCGNSFLGAGFSSASIAGVCSAQ